MVTLRRWTSFKVGCVATARPSRRRTRAAARSGTLRTRCVCCDRFTLSSTNYISIHLILTCLQASREEPLPQVDEAAYRRMFPLGNEPPVSSAAPASVASSFSFPAVSAQPKTVSTTPFGSAVPAVVSGGSYEDYLTEPSWRSVLQSEFQQPYWSKLMSFLQAERKRGAQIFPPENEVFSALNLCPFNSVRVVIIGQDPYHDDGQAHGLCFSVKPGVPPPPSLKNIYAELASDLGLKAPTHGAHLFDL